MGTIVVGSYDDLVTIREMFEKEVRQVADRLQEFLILSSSGCIIVRKKEYGMIFVGDLSS